MPPPVSRPSGRRKRERTLLAPRWDGVHHLPTFPYRNVLLVRKATNYWCSAHAGRARTTFAGECPRTHSDRPWAMCPARGGETMTNLEAALEQTVEALNISLSREGRLGNEVDALRALLREAPAPAPAP